MHPEIWTTGISSIGGFCAGFERSSAMKQRQRQYSGAFNAKVGLAALMGIKISVQVARESEVLPVLDGRWTKVIRERSPDIFWMDYRGIRSEDEAIADASQRGSLLAPGHRTRPLTLLGGHSRAVSFGQSGRLMLLGAGRLRRGELQGFISFLLAM